MYPPAVFLRLSKILDLLLSPIGWVLLLLAASLLWRRRAVAPWLAALALVALAAFSSGPVAQALVNHAEAGAPSTFRPGVTYDAVIVLGGTIDSAASRRSGTAEFDRAVDRVLRGFELARSGQARFVLISGGIIDPQAGEPSEAHRVAAKLREWGIPAARIVEEGTSRNTRENAVETARIVKERGWGSLLLVTSAMHMPRALATFRAAGLSPDALPVDWMGSDGPYERWLPNAGSLDRSSQALRELAGRLVYRVMGYAGG